MVHVKRCLELNGASRGLTSWVQRHYRVYVIRTRGVVFDTLVQRMTGLFEHNPLRVQFVVVLEGEYIWRHRGKEHTLRQGDALIAPLSEWNERWQGRHFRLLVTDGVARLPRPAQTVQMGRLDASALRRALEMADAVESGAPTGPAPVSSWLDLGESMGAQLVREAETPPTEVVRIHQALSALLTESVPNPGWIDLERRLGASERTVRRWVTQHRAWFEPLPGLRDRLLYWKLSSAGMLLSARGNRVGDVARVVGYGNDRALLRAMQDYGMPPASDLRRLLR